MHIHWINNFSEEKKEQILKDFLTQRGVSARIRKSKKYGYPFLSPKKKAGYINWAHTEKNLVIALSKAPCGVDIENARRSTRPLMKKIATHSEIDFFEKKLLTSLPASLRKVDPSLLLWVAKEAVSKAYGIGFRGSFKKIEIALSKKLPWKVETSFTVKTPFKLKEPYVNLVVKDRWIIALSGEKKEIIKYAFT